jgi:hypothetical protein
MDENHTSVPRARRSNTPSWLRPEVGLFSPLHDLEGRAHGLCRIVLVGRRHADHGQDGVAGVLFDAAAPRVNAGCDGGEIPLEQGAQPLGVGRLPSSVDTARSANSIVASLRSSPRSVARLARRTVHRTGSPRGCSGRTPGMSPRRDARPHARWRPSRAVEATRTTRCSRRRCSSGPAAARLRSLRPGVAPVKAVSRPPHAAHARREPSRLELPPMRKAIHLEVP